MPAPESQVLVVTLKRRSGLSLFRVPTLQICATVEELTDLGRPFLPPPSYMGPWRGYGTHMFHPTTSVVLAHRLVRIPVMNH